MGGIDIKRCHQKFSPFKEIWSWNVQYVLSQAHVVKVAKNTMFLQIDISEQLYIGSVRGRSDNQCFEPGSIRLDPKTCVCTVYFEVIHDGKLNWSSWKALLKLDRLPMSFYITNEVADKANHWNRTNCIDSISTTVWNGYQFWNSTSATKALGTLRNQDLSPLPRHERTSFTPVSN